MAQRGEFDLIADLFAPLASQNPGALGLRDDAALLDVPDGCQVVSTVDAMVEGVHFSTDDAADLVARKLLRVNLSDLAAMGATPLSYLLTLARPATIDEAWLERFVRGLAEDQRKFGINLAGGDTVSTTGPLVLSLTALGAVPTGTAVLRSGARPGDDVYVSGTIGDAALGLALVLGRDEHDFTAISREDRNALVARLQTPEPRLKLGRALNGVATSAVDISDGLIADLDHIATASGVRLVLDLSALPVSDAAGRVVGDDEEARLALMAGGEDYELAFTAPPEEASRIQARAQRLTLPLTRIGCVVTPQEPDMTGVEVRGRDGASLSLPTGGYTHF